MTHPQLVKIESLVRRLEEAMEHPEDGTEKTLFSLASEYAEHCKRANDRLQVCAEIASKGKEMEYQALMAATRAPDLLDLCAVLSELQRDEWRTFCRHNHLPVPDPLQESAKQLIDPLYAKAGTFQRKLMEEYSAANSKRDFREALRVIRHVARLNPSDVNSGTQAQRLEDRLVREIVKTMEIPLKNGEVGALLAKLEEIEGLAPGRMPKPGEASEKLWIEALDLRRNVRRDEAIDESADLMAEAEAAWQDRDLPGVLELISRVTALMDEHEFTLRPNLRELHAEIGRWADEEVMKLKIEDRFRGKLTGLREAMRTIRDKELQSRKPTLEEYREDSFLIQRLWKEIAEFRKPVPAELQDEAQKLLGELNEKIALLEKAKRRNVILAVAGSSILLGACAVVAVFFWKAKEVRDQIARSLADRRARDLESRISEIEGDRPVWFIFSGLPSELEKGRSWLQIEKANAVRIGELVSGLDAELASKTAPADWTGPSLAALKNRIEEAKAGAAGINEDDRSGISDRIAKLEREWKQVVGARRDLVVDEFHTKLEQFDGKVREGLDLDQALTDLRKAVTETSAIVADLDVLAHGELEELKPLAADLTRFSLLKAKFSEIEGKVEKAGSVMAASREADSLEAYLAAVRDLGETGVIEGSQKLAHANLILKVRSEESVLREIVAPGNVALWTRLKGGAFSGAGHPAAVEGEETVRFLSLRDDENLGEIHRYPVTENGKSRQIYSRGPMRIRNSRLGDVAVIEAEGDKVFDPERFSGTEVVFNSAKYVHRKSPVGTSGALVENGARCPESILAGKVRLGSFVDANVTSYRDTLLKGVDRILEAGEDVNPLYKAYLHLKLGELMMERKDQWLIGFTDFEEDYLELKKIVDRELTSADWLVPSLVEEYGGPLKEFYRARSATSHASTGLAVYRVYERLLAAGLHYHGFVDLKDGLEIVVPDDAAKVIWGCDKDLKIVKLFRKTEGGDWGPLAEPAPFTPVFVLGVDSDQVLAEVCSAIDADPSSADILSRLPRPLYPHPEQ